MKIYLAVLVLFVFSLLTNAQSKNITQAEYDQVFRYAVSETNSRFPHIFTVKTQKFESGKVVRTEEVINENESQGYYRRQWTTTADGKTSYSYQLTVGFGNIFCSGDGKQWTKSRYECPRERTIYAPRTPESTVYSVAQKKINGQVYDIYRSYSVFVSGKKSGFVEKESTIDAKGFFVSVVDTRGTLKPRKVESITTQTWNLDAKFSPIVEPTS